ncbi:MAG: hypothetical protein QOD74_1605 [Variibacter sp.]|nr:hypothetical protein [Variibacter sp.]
MQRQPANDEAEDGIERWGRRIGRTLGFLGCVALAVYLYLTYVR